MAATAKEAPFGKDLAPSSADGIAYSNDSDKEDTGGTQAIIQINQPDSLATRVEKRRSSHFEDLPNEILNRIASHLTAASSACFGVTCSRFYTIHWRLRGRVSLNSFQQVGRYLDHTPLPSSRITSSFTLESSLLYVTHSKSF